MSFPGLCDACALGDHEHHQDWTGTPGLIGGSDCPCRGECGTPNRSPRKAEAVNDERCDRDRVTPADQKLVNLTPHEVRIIHEDERPDVIFPPSGELLRLSTVDLGSRLTGFVGDVWIEYVEFGHLLNPPPKIPGTWYIVSLPCALAAPREDFLVPYVEVRDGTGRIIGCRGLGMPV